MYSIIEVSERLGLTARALRFYEQHGLLSPARYGNRRMYSDEDCRRIARIMRLTRFGFTLRQIKADRFPIETFEAQLDVLRDQSAELVRAIADLEKLIADHRTGADAPRRGLDPS